MTDRRTFLAIPAVAIAGAVLTRATSGTPASAATSATTPSTLVPQQSPVNVVRSAVQVQTALPQLQIHYSRSVPVSVHYVSKDDPTTGGCIARGAEETEEADRILSQLAGECGEPIEVENLNLRALLPANPSTLRYNGSLTTAPYSEGVQWFLTVPKTVSPQSIAAFRGLFPDGDSRSSQALNGRHLLADVHWSGHW